MAKNYFKKPSNTRFCFLYKHRKRGNAEGKKNIPNKQPHPSKPFQVVWPSSAFSR